jgi:hypothetical protein
MIASHRQRGIFALWLAVLLPALIALFALLIESTQLFAVRHRQQSAVDAAALAAAYQILRHDEAGIAAAATHAASANGFPVGADTTLAVSHPPADGRYAGAELAVRARIEHHPSRLFTAVVPGKDPIIGTSATAGFRRGRCILTLAPTGASSIDINTDAVIEAPYCSAQIDSSAGRAFRVRNRARVTLLDLRIVGTPNIHASATVTPAAVSGAAAVTDPMLGVPEPAVGGCNYNNFVVSGTMTLAPGTYCNGLRINASARANLQPGNYVIAAGILDLRNLAVMAGSEVTVFLMQGARLQMNATATLQLSARSSGTHAHVVIFESRSAPLDVATHNLSMPAATLLEGLVYLPRSALSITSSAPTPANTGARALALIARKASLSGRIRLNFDPLFVPESVRYRAWLAE